MHPSWFEISPDGWHTLAARRSLGRLLLEAVQNSFDAGATSIHLQLAPNAVTIEDDSPDGFADQRLVYTVFLSNKRSDPRKRGRLGRGLKEMIAAMDATTIEAVGTTVVFDHTGRHVKANDRERGTHIFLQRQFPADELEQARRMLRLCVPPKRCSMIVDGKRLKRRKRFLALPSCELETVVVVDGVERAVTGMASVSLYTPAEDEVAHIYEMGLPVESWDVPWHVDVGQRVPLTDGRDRVPDGFKLRLKATLLESMFHRYLDVKDLRADWVLDVISRFPVKQSVLDAYVSRAFPRGAVLGGTSRANDRAAQLGAHIIDASTVSHGAYMALSRVVETADDYVRRRSHEFESEEVAPNATQKRFAESVRWLARRIAGRVITVRFFARDPNDAGLLEDATADATSRVISFNVRGPLRFDDFLDPQTLGVVLHEIAHLDHPEHDHPFIDRLQYLAGMTTRVLAEASPELIARLRAGDPDQKRNEHKLSS